jgi:hypothetical protein
MNVIRDSWLFIINIFVIVKAWIVETKEEHKFTNVLVPIIVLGVFFFSYLGIIFEGRNWRTVAFWVFIFWLGQQTQGIISIFKKLKKQNNW